MMPYEVKSKYVMLTNVSYVVDGRFTYLMFWNMSYLRFMHCVELYVKLVMS